MKHLKLFNVTDTHTLTLLQEDIFKHCCIVQIIYKILYAHSIHQNDQLTVTFTPNVNKSAKKSKEVIREAMRTLCYIARGISREWVMFENFLDVWLAYDVSNDVFGIYSHTLYLSLLLRIKLYGVVVVVAYTYVVHGYGMLCELLWFIARLCVVATSYRQC